jgi:hypothetical protein
MGHLPRFDRAHSVPVRRINDCVFDPESSATTTLPHGGRKWSFRAVRTHSSPPSTQHSCSNSHRLLPNPSSITLSSTGHVLVLSQPQGELTFWGLFYEKPTPLPALRFAPAMKESKAQGSGSILGWISSLSGVGVGKVMSREEVDMIRMFFLLLLNAS